MSRVSIVIVSYNVRYFLRQCLQAIQKSVTEAELEIIVVDNNSEDASVDMLTNDFADVTLIRNKENLGFSKANNQGFKSATGEYILILNPDTIIQEDTIQTCLEYIQKYPETGAIGVKMLDGSGRYLPESKRGFPSPLGSLFKMTGLAKLFRQSSFFNSYYMGHLDPDSIHQVEVLSGAFIFTSKVILEEIGGFDEDYFMYGEDIELCAQIRNKDKKIVYLPSSSIIHFKGESTNKNTLDYLRRFYGAMQIYSGKRSQYAGWQWRFLLNAGIFLAGVAAFFKSLSRLLLWPALNILVLFILAKGIQKLWAILYFKNAEYYKSAQSDWSLLILILGLVLCYYIFGQFDKVYRKKQWIYSAFLSGLMLLAIYGLFPMNWRFSRSVLVFLVLLSPFVMFALRLLYNKITTGRLSFDTNENKRVLVVGKKDSAQKVASIIEHYYRQPYVKKFELIDGQQFLQTDRDDIVSMCSAYNCNELIFCSSDMVNSDIFELIAELENMGINFKIANNDNTGILGSHSKNSLGEWYTVDIGFKLSQQFHKRSKRLLDVGFSVLSIIMFPLVIILSKQKKDIYSNTLSVLLSRKTWIAYDQSDYRLSELPPLRRGVFSCSRIIKAESTHQANLIYARHYTIWLEMEYLLRFFFS